MTKQPQNPPESDLPKLSQPARRALIEAGYLRLEQLNGVKISDILKLHGVGKKTIVMLRPVMAERGMAFAEES